MRSNDVWTRREQSETLRRRGWRERRRPWGGSAPSLQTSVGIDGVGKEAQAQEVPSRRKLQVLATAEHSAGPPRAYGAQGHTCEHACLKCRVREVGIGLQICSVSDMQCCLQPVACGLLPAS